MILCQIEDLQLDLLKWLLDKVFSEDLNEDDADAMGTQSSRNQGPSLTQVCTSSMYKISFKFLNCCLIIWQMILSQLVRLNKIFDPDALTEKVKEILPCVSQPLQQHLIPALPDLVPESHHSQISLVLR